MMKKYIKLKSTEIFIIIGFFISIYSFSIIVSSIQSYYKCVTEENKFNRNYNNVVIQNTVKTQSLSMIQLLEDNKINNIISSENETIIKHEDKYVANDIVGAAKGFDINKYGEIEGRDFSKNELNGTEKVAIIGKNISRLTEKKNNKQYIKVFNDYYEVIGIVKDNEYWRQTTIVPIRSLNSFEGQSNKFSYRIDRSSTNKLAKLNTSSMTINVTPLEEKNVIKYLFDNVYDLKDYVYQLAFSIINLIIFTSFFSYSIKRKLAIMRVLGAKNSYIFKEIFTKLIKLSLISIILGIIFSSTTIHISNIGIPNQFKSLNIYNVLITTFLTYIIIFIFSFVILLNIMKFNLLKDIR